MHLRLKRIWEHPPYLRLTLSSLLDFIPHIAQLRERITRELGSLEKSNAIRNQYVADLEQAELKLADAECALRVLEETCVVIAAIEESQRKELKDKIENLVSYALSVVFDKSYKFRLQLSQRGKQTEAEFLVEVPEHPGVEFQLKDAHGGGLVAVVAFVLQLVVALSSKPALRRFMVLDEPFSQVSAEFKDKLMGFVRELADKTDVQFLFITHDPEIIAIGDKKYRFQLTNGVTKAVEID